MRSRQNTGTVTKTAMRVVVEMDLVGVAVSAADAVCDAVGVTVELGKVVVMTRVLAVSVPPIPSNVGVILLRAASVVGVAASVAVLSMESTAPVGGAVTAIATADAVLYATSCRPTMA